jgi:aspartyl-tRNA(Asn)/glutamyl-tRNA(Gln) amidotransferase subunit C
MTLDETTVDRVAHLARLRFDETSKEQMREQLNQMLAFVEKIGAVNTEDVAPLTHCIANTNVKRPDAVEPSTPKEDLEGVAVEFENNHFVIPRVIE